MPRGRSVWNVSPRMAVFRIHKSYLINTRFLERFERSKVYLLDGTELDVAERRRAEFARYMKEF